MITDISNICFPDGIETGFDNVDDNLLSDGTDISKQASNIVDQIISKL